MVKLQERALAEKLRKAGYSYSMILKRVKVSKSTLSGWLKEVPLSTAKMRELRDFNSVRIEKTRQAKLLKKQVRRDVVFEMVKADFKKVKPRYLKKVFIYIGEREQKQPSIL